MFSSLSETFAGVVHLSGLAIAAGSRGRDKALAELASQAAYSTGTSCSGACSAIMEHDDSESPSGSGSTFKRLRQRRAIIAELDNALRASWQAIIAECEPFAEPALERALERYTNCGPRD